MNKYRWLLALSVLVLAALACQTVMGGGKGKVPVVPTEAPPAGGQNVEPPSPTEPAPSLETPEAEATAAENQDSTPVSSKFPLPDGATNVMELGQGVNFQAKMSLEDAMKFYRDEFGKQGLKERKILTVTSETTFSMVFDGDPSGKAIVIQGVDLGNGTINISILLEDV